MGRIKAFSLQDDIALANAIQIHKCLYDKSYSKYGETEECGKSWKQIEETLDLEPDTAPQLFVALKKRYSRKRVSVKKAYITGVGKAAARKGLKEYEFLKWLDPYIRIRRTKFDVDDQDVEYFDDMTFNHGHMMLDQATTHRPLLMEKGEPTNNLSYNPTNQRPTLYSDMFNSSDGRSSFARCNDSEDSYDPKVASEMTITNNDATQVNKRNPTYHSAHHMNNTNDEDKSTMSSKIYPSSTNRHAYFHSRFDNAVEERIKKMDEKVESKPIISECHIKDGDDIYGEMVASEIKKFPDHVKYRIKNDFQNILFKYQMSVLTPHSPADNEERIPYNHTTSYGKGFRYSLNNQSADCETSCDTSVGSFSRENIQSSDVKSSPPFSDYSMVNPLNKTNNKGNI